MKAIPSSAVDTARAPERERFAIWHAALSPTHDVGLPEGADRARFNASARGWMLGRALVLESRSTPQVLRRTPGRIRTDQTDHYILRVQRKGNWIAEMDGRVVKAAPGSVTILDMGRPSHARTTEIENINILLQRDMLDEMLPPFGMHGLVLHDSLGALLRDHLESLAENLPFMQPADAAGVADATCRLIAACLAPSQDSVARARAPLLEIRLRQVRAHIDAHLCAPDLSARSICAALRISRSTLYNVCEPMGGVTAFIRQRRLRRIHALLANPYERRMISEIAYRFGFVNNSHFSRAFRNTYGYSPREAREAGMNGEGLNVRTPGGGMAYASWIRRIGA